MGTVYRSKEVDKEKREVYLMGYRASDDDRSSSQYSHEETVVGLTFRVGEVYFTL